MPEDPPIRSVYCEQRSRLWQGLWNLRLGKPKLVTKTELRNRVTHFDVPDDVFIDCLRSFHEEGLIRCCDKNNLKITNPYPESDYERFGITLKGANLGPNYKCE